MTEENHRERRRLSDEDVRRIASEIMDRVSLEVGKSLLRRVAWFIALAIIAGLVWVGNHVSLK